MNYREIIYEYYNYFLDTYDVSNPTSMGWTNKQTQIIRFKKLLEIGVKSENTLLDYGCGLGDLINFMEENGIDTRNYTGMDISYRYLKKARELHPKNEFLLCEIDDVLNQYDYIVASGVFTIGMPMEYIFNAIDKCYQLCNYGFAFNMIDDAFTVDKPYFFNTANPQKMYGILKEKYDNVVLINDYLKNEDFTIYIYK